MNRDARIKTMAHSHIINIIYKITHCRKNKTLTHSTRFPGSVQLLAVSPTEFVECWTCNIRSRFRTSAPRLSKLTDLAQKTSRWQHKHCAAIIFDNYFSSNQFRICSIPVYSSPHDHRLVWIWAPYIFRCIDHSCPLVGPDNNILGQTQQFIFRLTLIESIVIT